METNIHMYKVCILLILLRKVWLLCKDLKKITEKMGRSLVQRKKDLIESEQQTDGRAETTRDHIEPSDLSLPPGPSLSCGPCVCPLVPVSVSSQLSVVCGVLCQSHVKVMSAH